MENTQDHTSKMLKELSEVRKRKNVTEYDSEDDNEYSGIKKKKYDSEDADEYSSIKKKKYDHNFSLNKIIKEEVNSELNNFRQNNRTPELGMMANLLEKNIELVENNSNLKKDFFHLQKELRNTETREYRKETYANNLIVQRDELKIKCDDFSKDIKLLNIKIEDSDKIIFWQKFLFVFQVLLTSYGMMAFNYDKIVEYFNL